MIVFIFILIYNRGMYDLERQDKILEILKEKKSISVDKLTKLMYVSAATIRRDLTQMEKRGLVHRTFGGVVLQESPNEESSILFRENTNTKEKRRMSELCSQLTKDNTSIFLDSSSTVMFLVPFLRDYRRLNIVTNGVKVALLLSQETSSQILLLPGYINSRSASVVGNMAISALSRIHCNIAIMSCSGLNLEYGVMESTVDQAEIKAKMLENSDMTILLCDLSKFGKKELFATFPLSKVDYLITSGKPADEYIQYCKEHDIKLIY